MICAMGALLPTRMSDYKFPMLEYQTSVGRIFGVQTIGVDPLIYLVRMWLLPFSYCRQVRTMMNEILDEAIPVELSYMAPTFEAPKESADNDKDVPSDTRDAYQRDLGRIIHSASFRRLQTKTQVMGTGEGDFHRTRLTHSLEVGQIGRGIVWNLARRPDANSFRHLLPTSELIEAICYAHDLGHPPYGHGGERALHSKMKNYGGFEGNAQTLRILTRLEKYYKGEGIHATRRLLLGVLKYPVAYCEYGEKASGQKPPKCFYDEDLGIVGRALSIFSPADQAEFRKLGTDSKPMYKDFDCSIMELADDIAYGVHDLEDGIGRNILKAEEVGGSIINGFKSAGVSAVRDVPIDNIVKKLFSCDSCERKHAISLLVGYFITSIVVQRRNIFESELLDYQAIVPGPVRDLLDHLAKEITYKSIVERREVQTLEFKGEKIISDLFEAFWQKPLLLIGATALDPFELGAAAIFRKLGNENRSNSTQLHWDECESEDVQIVARAICDFVAGMTNPYAEKYHRRLFEPGFGSSTDEL